MWQVWQNLTSVTSVKIVKKGTKPNLKSLLIHDIFDKKIWQVWQNVKSVTKFDKCYIRGAIKNMWFLGTLLLTHNPPPSWVRETILIWFFWHIFFLKIIKIDQYLQPVLGSQIEYLTILDSLGQYMSNLNCFCFLK